MEPVFALSIPETRAAFATKLPAWIRWLAHDVVEPGVLHYGERIFYCDGETPCEPGRRYLHSIGFPHIWSGTEAYIAAAFVHGLTGPDCPAGLTIGEAVCVTGN